MFNIERVVFTNFRQYRDPKDCAVDFVYDKSLGKNINVVEGTNGYGKSNFLAGILWCLYGDEGKDIGRGLLKLNRLSGDELSEGDTTDVVVEIVINTDDEDKYSIKRTARFKKMNGEVSQISLGSSVGGTKFEIFAFSQGQSRSTENPEKFVSILIPKKMREYFFFDGEKLEKYFDSAAHRAIKGAVFNVSQLDVLDTIIQQSEELGRKFQRQINRLPGADVGVGSKITTLDGEINALEGDIVSLGETRENLETKYNEVFHKFTNAGGEEAQKLVVRKNEIDGILASLADPIAEKDLICTKLLAEFSPFTIGHQAVCQADEIFKKAEEDEIIPPNIRVDYIDKLLDKGYCICKESVAGGDTHSPEQIRRAHLVSLKESIPAISTRAHEALEAWTGIKDILRKESAVWSDIDKVKSEKQLLVEKQKMLVMERDKIMLEIADEAALSGLGDLKSEIREIVSEIERTGIRISQKKSEIEEKRKEKVLLEKKQKELTKSSQDSAVLERKREILQNLRLVAATIQNRIMEQTRTEVALHTKEFFSDLMIEDITEIEIEINNEYELSCEVGGKDMIVSFAAGQKAALALAFLMALNKFSGFDAPLLFDSVVGRIGVEMRKKFSNILPKTLATKQIIFLLLDSEFDEGVRGELSQHIGSHYKIDRRKGDEKFVTESALIKQ